MRFARGVLCFVTLGWATSLAQAASPTAVEYYHGGYRHYFVTAWPQEIAALDAGSIPGWSRTGESFQVLDLGAAGSADVCRLWSAATFAPRSSHFYSPFAGECTKVRANPAWHFEGEVFAMRMPDASGNCAAGTVPLYRFYNDGRSGSPNHRYTTSAAVRAEMVAQGWTPEGVGIGVIGCVPGADSFTVVAAGDIGNCGTGPAAASATARTAALITPQDALVLTLGDHANELGTTEDFASCFDPTWGRFKDRIRPSPGNHDITSLGADGYFDYFGAQAGPDRRGYYSFDYGGWHFISLNTMGDVSEQSAQYRWLQEDLAKSRDSACTIAYWHHPAFNSGSGHGSAAEVRPMFEALHAAGVEILLSGHEHLYERFAPQSANGAADPARGVRQFVVGTGGRSLHGFGTPLPNSEYRHSGDFGVLRLALGPGAYRWEFLPVDGGAPLDAGSATCHR